LLRKWIIAIAFELNRDWTYDGLDDSSFDITEENLTGGVTAVTDLGSLYLRQTVGRIALQGDFPDRRDSTRLIFFHAFDPHPPVNQFPVSPQLRYRVTPNSKRSRRQLLWSWT
jgi:hypothetical protein